MLPVPPKCPRVGCRLKAKPICISAPLILCVDKVAWDRPTFLGRGNAALRTLRNLCGLGMEHRAANGRVVYRPNLRRMLSILFFVMNIEARSASAIAAPSHKNGRQSTNVCGSMFFV